MKVTGYLNGDDVYCLRKMFGGSNFSGDTGTVGKLTTLDLSAATIVEGGGWYCERNDVRYYTSNNIIGNNMFYACANLYGIVLPKNVNWIGDYAFSQCGSLIEIIIPDNITWIGKGAFSNCGKIHRIILGKGITSINAYTCFYCSSLTEIVIPEQVTQIGMFAFANCYGLRKLVFGKKLEKIVCSAFYLYDITECYSYNPISPLIDGGVNVDGLEGFPVGNCVLYVPKGSITSYKNSTWGSKFKDIREVVE